jgi:hypothetical protein
MDSSVSPTHGEQELSVRNGRYECTCYHPLFVFNQFGDLERCASGRTAAMNLVDPLAGKIGERATTGFSTSSQPSAL